MKKQRILSLICCALAATVCFSSCQNILGGGGSNNHPSKEKNYGTPTNVTDYSSGADVEGTIHIYDKTLTSNYVMKGGVTEYKILLPNTPNDYEEYAATELQYFFRESTGKTLAIEREVNGVNYTSGKYISIGATTLQKSCGESFDYDTLGYGGFKIVTSGNSIVASGAQKYGTLYSVYELLHQLFDWETYSADCIVYDTNVKEIPLYDYDIIDVPDLPWRHIDAGTVVSNNRDLQRRLRFNNPEDIFAFPGGWCHNTFHALPPSTYLASHKDWYSRDTRGNIVYSSNSWESDQPSQICYSCEDPEMMELIVDAVTGWLEDAPDVEIVCFSQEDNRAWCKCSKCSESYKQYGADSAVLIKFMNRLYAQLEPWIEESGREITLAFFGYQCSEDAPAKLEDGKYVPMDDSVKCHENVAVMYAPIEADYSKPLSHESNTVEYQNLLKWGAISEKLLLWTYSADYQSYLAPYNTFDSIQENYKIAVRNGAFWLFDQQQKGAQNSTGFQILKYYLEAKLSWNVNLDINELIDNFFENYFGEANEPMRKIFDAVRTRMAYIENELHIAMYVYVKLENTNFWPKGLLQQWLRYIDEAYEAIESVKNEDEELYAKLYDRIMLEGISYRWLLIELYGTTTYNEERLLEEKLSFKQDCAYLKVTNYAESWTPNLNDYLKANWGI